MKKSDLVRVFSDAKSKVSLLGSAVAVLACLAVISLYFTAPKTAGARPDCPGGDCECPGGRCIPAEPICPIANPDDPASLEVNQLPPIPELNEYVKDESKLIDLGKALFWDQQVGSDGVACASCHFHAGADNRDTNQLSPGFAAVTPDFKFNSTKSHGLGPNHKFVPTDFPFHVKTDITRGEEPNNPVTFDTNDVASSSGAFKRQYHAVMSGQLEDVCTAIKGTTFSLNGKNTRQVPPRNTPSTINAAFNHRNFWDGRANAVFNGVDSFGLRGNIANRAQGVYRLDNGKLQQIQIEISNSSLASQAVGPTVSDIEMSCRSRNSSSPDAVGSAEYPNIANRFRAVENGRNLMHVGRKLIPARALKHQTVHENDSRLGKYVSAGLPTYGQLIRDAFKEEWWSSQDPVMVGEEQFTQMEANFSLFFGLAVQHYERLLISNQTPYDQFKRSGRSTVQDNGSCAPLSREAGNGLKIFTGRSSSTGYPGSGGGATDGKCVNCHKSPVFTAASTQHLLNEQQQGGLIELMTMGNSNRALYDNGFYNIGVRPWSDDIGLGGTDGLMPNTPLSFTEQFVNQQLFGIRPPDRFRVSQEIQNTRGVIPRAVTGAFKTPGLRNVELTGPYFHNGGQSTLQQVVEFYNRGGDFGRTNIDFLDPDIKRLGLTAADQQALVAFLKSLTDPRVVNESEPFDHPSLEVPHGHTSQTCLNAVELCEVKIAVPAVGRMGRSSQQLPPIKPFLE
jgi:cytochrome c peroxidase